MQITVAPMRLEDLEAVLEIEAASFSVPWTRNSFVHELLENERAVYLVARSEWQRVLGYIGMWVVFDEGHITNLATHPAYRRQGVATDLLKALFMVAKEKGIHHVTLEVRRSNLNAQELYQRMGFVHMGVRRKYYLDNNEDAFIMWKGPL